MPLIEKDRYLAPEFMRNVFGYDVDSAVKYVAHWVWWEGSHFRVQRIGAEQTGAGLQKNTMKHPDQVFWKQKKLVARPHETAAIVTDCKLLPCTKSGGCAYRVPSFVASRFTAGIPMAVFAHNGTYFKETGKLGYYTESGASISEIDAAMRDMFRWDWDEEGDESEYLDDES